MAKAATQRPTGHGDMVPGARTVRGRRLSWGGMIFLVVMTAYCLLPIYWIIVSAGKTTDQLLSSNGFEPTTYAGFISNLAHLFTYENSAFAYWLCDTLLYAGIGGMLATLFATAAGYAFAKYTFRGKTAIFSVILAGFMVPLTVLSVPLYLLAHSIGLLGTVWSVLVPSCVTPLGVYLARIYAARSVPDEVIDAARIDGASELAIFLRVSLRLMLPAVVTIFLFTFVAIWNNFFLPLVMLSNDKLYPLSLGLYNWMSESSSVGAPSFLYATVVTGALVSIIPLAIAFILLQRYWTTGLSLGALVE